jgi:hypothetical protein
MNLSIQRLLFSGRYGSFTLVGAGEVVSFAYRL